MGDTSRTVLCTAILTLWCLLFSACSSEDSQYAELGADVARYLPGGLAEPLRVFAVTVDEGSDVLAEYAVVDPSNPELKSISVCISTTAYCSVTPIHDPIQVREVRGGAETFIVVSGAAGPQGAETYDRPREELALLKAVAASFDGSIPSDEATRRMLDYP